VLREPGAPFVLEELSIDGPRDDEVLVRMVASGVCHTDVVFQGAPPIPTPLVLGHEGAGVVEAVGDGVRALAPGDHVVLSFSSCGQCQSCRDKRPSYCQEFAPLNMSGIRLEDGSTPLSAGAEPVRGLFFGQSSFASMAITRASNAVKVEPSLPLEHLAPLGCGVQTGAGTVLNTFDVEAERGIAVFGSGAVGLSAVMAAVIRGAGTIVVVEPNMARRELAVALGASATIDPFAVPDLLAAVIDATGGGVDYAIDTTGNPEVISAAGESLRPNGSLALLGIPQTETNIPLSLGSMAVRGANISFVSEGDSDPARFIPELIMLYEAGRFPSDRLVSTFPFAQINEAFEAAKNGAAIKPVLLF
jgi:Zn-dependent alcohol dehydrogenase